MIEAQLSTQSIQKTIAKFESNVLEFFYVTSNEGGIRYHLGHIKSIELTTNKAGKHTLVMATQFHTRKEEVDNNALEKVKALISEVQRALQSIAL